MSLIFDKLEQHSKDFQQILESYLEKSDETHNFPWDNFIFEGPGVRRAHLDVVDKREERKLYMMHLCIFPNRHNPGPIYGFDLIAGPNKVTGAFHDISPASHRNHILCDVFHDHIKDVAPQWSKERELPDWAKQIFSGDMIAAGNVRDVEELDLILNFSKESLRYCLDYFVNKSSVFDEDFVEEQNRYCKFQKQNPHTPKVMESLGYDPELVRDFIDNCLFPEVVD